MVLWSRVHISFSIVVFRFARKGLLSFVTFMYIVSFPRTVSYTNLFVALISSIVRCDRQQQRQSLRGRKPKKRQTRNPFMVKWSLKFCISDQSFLKSTSVKASSLISSSFFILFLSSSLQYVTLSPYQECRCVLIDIEMWQVLNSIYRSEDLVRSIIIIRVCRLGKVSKTKQKYKMVWSF